MTKLKLDAILDDRPVKVTLELPADLFRDLAAYADILAKSTGATAPIDPAKLITPMLFRFMATDRAFAKITRHNQGSIPSYATRRWQVATVSFQSPHARATSMPDTGNRQRDPPAPDAQEAAPRTSILPPACRSLALCTTSRMRSSLITFSPSHLTSQHNYMP
jgi:hypothetical protein